MKENVFDISQTEGQEAAPEPEASYEPPTYLPSSLPGSSAPIQPGSAPGPAPAAAQDVPEASAPADPPVVEFLPTVPQQPSLAVRPQPVADEASGGLLNAPPPTPVDGPAPESYRAASEPVNLTAHFVDAPAPNPLDVATPAPGPVDIAGPTPNLIDLPGPKPVAPDKFQQPPVFTEFEPTQEQPPVLAEPAVHLKTEASPMQPAAQSPADFPPPQPTPPSVSAAFESRRNPNLQPDADLEEALQKVLMTSGSDLHITVDAPPMIRVDGALKPVAGAAPWNQEKVTAALLSILTPSQKAKFDEDLEFDFAYTLSANARFRVNFYQQRNNIGAAFRLIPTEIKSLRDLGVPEVIGNFAKLARGLVLVTGPTGSGKSTTLAGLIDIVNRTRADHIMTVEDPIEFLHSNHKSLVNQREVGHDTHSFAAALKHVLRQDPDVILVGELRDLETISVALTAAETGHLVFATLHTQDAPQTIDRIIDVYSPHQQNQVRAQLAATLQGVVCQTLVKRANGQGRVVATEVLVGTHAVANLIREGKTYQVHSAMQAGRELGMHTMDQHLADLVNTGQITFEAAMEKAHDAEVLKRLVTRTEPALAGAMSNGVNFGDSYSMGM